MILSSMVSFLPLLFAFGDAPGAGSVRIMRVEEQMIVKVPVAPRPRVRVKWRERGNLKCVPAGHLRGAMLSGEDTIDFLLRRGVRMRARLDSDCRGLDFYGKLYVQTEDDMICAKRDYIRSRAGAACRIDRLRLLVAEFDD